MEQLDFVVVGAGVVGLAVAAEITKQGEDRSVIVLERHSKFGQDTSSRNSEVIHAGMYYPTGSLKAAMCVEGNPLLYQFCEQYDIPHQRIGKIIVARDESEISGIENLIAQGKINGVHDLQLLDRDQLARLEPNVSAVAGVLSPSTGIIDSHKLMVQLERLALEGYAMLAYKHEVIRVSRVNAGYEVIFRGPDGEVDSLECRWLINCAGLYSDRIPEYLGIDTSKAGYKIYPVKGEYFSVSSSKSKLISHLVYPPPLKGLKGLGTHVTKSLDGRARLGPNAFYVQEMESYDVEAEHLEEFYQAAKTYLPFIQREDLQPDMAGMRAKIQAPDAPVADFVVCHETERKFPGLINLVGIESPGLTSCLALAKKVAGIITAAEQ